MKIEKFEDIIAWQTAENLTIEIYKHFKDCKDFSFKDQIQRAAISTMNNIAEGFERYTNKDLKNFLYIAKGSCGEIRSMLVLAVKLNYITQEQYNRLFDLSVKTSKLISGFIKTL